MSDLIFDEFTGLQYLKTMKEIKTSKDWWPIVRQDWIDNEKKELIIYDPDGWDRGNWKFSWFEELITKEEFNNRVDNSTCMFTSIKL